MEKNNELSKSGYLIYAILFVTILILVGIAVSYAYFRVNTTETSTLGGINASLDCINISYGEEYTYTEDSKINLYYNYPISDEYALENIEPIIVQVTNNCTENTADVNYSLAITSLNNSENYISDDKIRLNIMRKLDSADEETLISPDYLSNMTKLTGGNAYTYLTEDLDTREDINSYTNRLSYVVDSNTIANGLTNTYKVYLWVDYYEGDTTHTGLNDNITEGKKFTATISLVVNP